ncbi:MAG: hypothetical protein QOJ65_1909 [Fimbriimonadaceae bacterium]|jgi:hypothetical protein|nr:hypothetical protein [Fimbriimonadaceae bacterium]
MGRLDSGSLVWQSALGPAAPAFSHADCIGEAHLLERLCCERTAESAPAIAEHALIAVLEACVTFVVLEVGLYFQEPSRDIDRAGHVTRGEFFWLAHVEDKPVTVFRWSLASSGETSRTVFKASAT